MVYQLLKGTSARVHIKNYPEGIDIKPEWKILKGTLTVQISSDGKSALITDDTVGFNRIAVIVGDYALGIYDIWTVEQKTVDLEFEVVQ